MVRNFYPNRIIPYNVAEAMIDPFFNDDIVVLERYTQSGFMPEYKLFKQGWRHIEFSGICGHEGEIGRLTRDCDIDATHYNHFNLRMTTTPNLRLEVFLTVDGVVQNVITADGAGEFREAEGAFQGNKIERIELVLTAKQPGNSACVIEWTGLFSSERMPLLELERPQYDSRWEGFLKPDSEIDYEHIAPLYGVFFGKEDLEGIRKKFLMPEYAVVVQSLRSRAAEFIGTQPEKEIGKVSRYLDAFTRDRIYYNGDKDWHVGAFTCAFLGLIEKDPALLRLGIRIALCIAHCGRFYSWEESLPDTTWEDRGFPDFIQGNAVSMTLDFAGMLLTDDGIHAIRDALGKKVVPHIYNALMRHEYMWRSNQGIWDISGWIITTCTLTHTYPHADMLLDRCFEILNEILDCYMDGDGGSFEGGAYLLFSLSMAMTALVAYSRVKGIPLSELAHEKLKKTPQYICTLMGEGSYPSTLIPLSDGGDLTPIRAIDSLCLLHHLFKDPLMLPIIRDALQCPYRDVSMSFSNPAAMIFGPDKFTEKPFASPTFRILQSSCMLSSSRNTPDGSVRLFLCGCGVIDAGHSHSDRGQLLIEAFGESLLYETGMINYSNTDHILLSKPRYHNLTAIGKLDNLTEQCIPALSACIPTGNGNEVSLSAKIDVTSSWGGIVTGFTREIISEQPTRITVIDEITLSEPSEVTQLWNSTGHFSAESSRYTLIKNSVRVIITPRFTVSSGQIIENMLNDRNEINFLLALEAPKAVKHRLVTEFVIEKM